MTQRLEAQGRYSDAYKWDDGSDNDNVSNICVQGDNEGICYIQFDYIKSGQVKYGLSHGTPILSFSETFEINHLKDEQLEFVEVYYNPNSGVILGLQFKTNMRASKLIGYVKRGINKVEECTQFLLAVGGKKIIGFHGSGYQKLNSLGAYFTWIAPTRMEAKGGKGSSEWNDGANYQGVTKIYVRGGCDGTVQYIKFDYVKDGQHIYGSTHGASDRDGYTQTFEINHLNKEYLESVEGYYDDNKYGVIQGLEFKTNIKTSYMIGYAKGNKFRLASNGKKIIGFHGYAKRNLNSLRAYFTTLPLTKLEYIGGIIFEYDDGGKVKRIEHGARYGKEEEFIVDYPNEFITSVEGTLGTASFKFIASLTFKTSKGRTSSTFGRATNNNFSLESKGCAVVGFHGRSNTSVYALGAYFRPLPPLHGSEKLEAQGGDGGDFWDDGGFNGIKNIYIGHNEIGIAFVKFLYDKDNQTVVGEDHGSKTLLGVDEFELEAPGEYLISIEGNYDAVDGSESKVIRMLKFKTNMRSSQMFGLETESNFTLEKECHKIVGFHGKVSNMLNQIGVYVLPIEE
ncbi:unnamed protein product [Cochlearia groenlandica]